MTLTPWFDAVTQPPMPDRPGWYQIWLAGFYSIADDLAWWDGARWLWRPGGAKMRLFGGHGDRWRGVLREDA